jgi:hypothetical protein
MCLRQKKVFVSLFIKSYKTCTADLHRKKDSFCDLDVEKEIIVFPLKSNLKQKNCKKYTLFHENKWTNKMRWIHKNVNG